MANYVDVDFSDVKERSGFNPKHQEPGDYLLKITKAELGKSKGGEPQITVSFQDQNLRSAVYPYYCPLSTNMLWKIRNVFIAAGQKVPKGKGRIDLDKIINKEVGATLGDDEYNGQLKSVIENLFHKDELEPVEAEDDDAPEDDEDEVEEADVDEEEDDEEETIIDAAPPAKKSKAKAKPAPEPEEDDEEEDDEGEPEPAPVKKKAAKAKAKPAPVEEDDEDDDLDLDDL